MANSTQLPVTTPDANGSRALTRRTVLTLAALASAASAGLLTGCKLPFAKKHVGGTALTSTVTRLTPTLEEAPNLVGAVAACDTLSSQLLAAQLADGKHANALASPASLALNLATAAVGASDPTAQGINAALGCRDEASRNTTWAALQTALLKHDGDPTKVDLNAKAPAKPFLHVAHQLTVVDGDKQTEVNQEFVDTVHRYFTADLRRVDVRDAKQVLSDWVDIHSGGLIKESAITTPKPGIVLQNAVLFTARWAAMFEKGATRDADFTAPGGPQTVKMMHQSKHMVWTEGTSEGRHWTAIRIPYKQDFALDVVLPDLGVLPEDLPTETWAQATALLDEAKSEGITPTVHLSLPRLDTQTAPGGVDLFPVLEALGVDIKPMGRVNPAFEILEYRQQVRLIVQEDGTKAAAVTERHKGATAPNPGDTVDFVVDHPYVLRLRDLTTGLCLFAAVINKPA